MHRRSLTRLIVRRRPGRPAQGWLLAGGQAIPVALGRTGIKANKFEGDGATPRGRFRLKRLWWRADRRVRPATLLPVRPIRPDDGWCENPAERRYNQPVTSVTEATDHLTRADALYDFIIELDHNTRPRVSHRGSAVFVHVARPGFAPTAGCIGLNVDRLRQLVARVGPHTQIVVE